MSLASYLAEKGLTDGELGTMLGVSAELVRLWRHGRRPISAKRAVDMSKVTGIPLHELRPDLWEPPGDPPRASPNAKPKPAAKRSRAPVKPSPKPKQGTRATTDTSTLANVA